MAKFNYVGIKDIISDIQLEAERIERNGDAALRAAADVAVAAMQKTVPVRHGDLKKSIGYTQIQKGKDGKSSGRLSVEVYPQGRRAPGKGQRYADYGFVLEYGRSNMPAQPWMEPAIEREGERVLETLENELMKD